MGQSLVKQYIHIIFSTKRQEPLILNSIENELFAYIGSICKNLECFPIIIGGYKNHIHVLCLLSKKIALMKLVEEIKSHSSKWIKTKDTRLKNFYWQNGYGAFSVSSSQVEIVKNYIENQHNHHKVKTFQEEYIEFLNSNQIEFDQRYLWD
jgi:putative transposase